MTSKSFFSATTKVHLSIVIALIINFLFCEYNFKKLCSDEIKSKSHTLTNNQQMINSRDNEYYVTPPENFINGKGWRRSPAIGEAGYIRRVPGYSTVYFVFRSMFGDSTYLIFLRYFQFFLFGVSCFAFLSLARFFMNEKSALVITLVYSVIPTVSVWTYFTLTEAITPAFMIFYIYFLIKGTTVTTTRLKLLLYSLSFLMLVSLILTRPYSGLAGIIFAVVILKEFRLRKITLFQVVLTTLVGFAIWSTWIVRNYSITGNFIPLEVAYNPQSADRMKPEFRGMFNLSKALGEDGAYFNTYHEPFFNAVLANGYDEKNNELVFKKLSQKTINELGKPKLNEVLNSHQKAILAQSEIFLDSSKVNYNYLPIQITTEKKYNQLIDKYRSENILSFYLTSRLKYLQRIIVHSNTAHIYVFSSPMNSVFKGIKAFLFLFHIVGYICLIIGIFIFLKKRKILPFVIFSVTPILFVFFFAFIHREVEQRYMLPVYPVIVLGIAWCYSELKEQLTFRR